jgi:alpha-tubulin suppressor-like RCC1 family protein
MLYRSAAVLAALAVLALSACSGGGGTSPSGQPSPTSTELPITFTAFQVPYRLYTARAGDTMESIAAASGITVQYLRYANRTTNVDPLDVGQLLVIPPGDGVLYQIQPGDSLQSIADLFGVAPGDIVGWRDNQFHSVHASLRATDVLFVPGGIIPGPQLPVRVAVGAFHTCAIIATVGVKCWGGNDFGQLGNGTRTSSLAPVDVLGLSNVVALAAGEEYTCALTASGGVKCWGRNENGQLGDGTTAYRVTPVGVIGLRSNVMGLSAGGVHTCAVTFGGAVKCWGENSGAQLGVGQTTGPEHCIHYLGTDAPGPPPTMTSPCSTVPLDVAGLSSGVASVSAGLSHTCALFTAGNVKCWGANDVGALGQEPTDYYQTTPVDALDIENDAVAIAVGNSTSCALTRSGGVRCWGMHVNEGGTSAVGIIGAERGVVALGAGQNRICALLARGTVRCWGEEGVDESFNEPAVAIATGPSANHMCVITVSGRVKCWGYNIDGQLGDGGACGQDCGQAVDVIGIEDALEPAGQ